jgi:hypothetical protein
MLIECVVLKHNGGNLCHAFWWIEYLCIDTDKVSHRRIEYLCIDTNNTGWDNLDTAIDAEEEGMRWDKYRAVVFTSEVVAAIASTLVRDTVDTDILIAQ